MAPLVQYNAAFMDSAAKGDSLPMKEHVLPPLPALLAPVVDAAMTLALGWLLFSMVELGIYASLVAPILSCLITIVSLLKYGRLRHG
jgi:hypothetical protein